MEIIRQQISMVQKHTHAGVHKRKREMKSEIKGAFRAQIEYDQKERMVKKLVCRCTKVLGWKEKGKWDKEGKVQLLDIIGIVGPTTHVQASGREMVER